MLKHTDPPRTAVWPWERWGEPIKSGSDTGLRALAIDTAGSQVYQQARGIPPARLSRGGCVGVVHAELLHDHIVQRRGGLPALPRLGERITRRLVSEQVAAPDRATLPGLQADLADETSRAAGADAASRAESHCLRRSGPRAGRSNKTHLTPDCLPERDAGPLIFGLLQCSKFFRVKTCDIKISVENH